MKLPHQTFALAITAVIATSFAPVQAFQAAGQPGLQMSQAAQEFTAKLTNDQKEACTFEYSDPERINWHFIPRDRKGLGLWDLEGDALEAANELVSTGLTAAGYHKVLEVRSLEEVLYLFEGGEEAARRKKRNPHRYYVSIFGTPGPTGLWGWRFEGHHLSLNYSIQDGEIVSSTPEFFGANPGLIDAGPGRSLRVLGKREDIARQILKACPDSRIDQLWLSKKAPKDIRGGGVAQPVIADAEGLAYSDMTLEQQKLLKELIAEYLTAMPAPVVRERMQQIKESGMDSIHFGWWGGPELNEPHHYVVQGKTFVIEYNNTQNSANHVHAIWRNLAGDFNLPTASR